MPAGQARIIAQALQRFEKLKPAYLQQVRATQGWRAVHGQDSTVIASNTKLIDWYKVAYGEEQGLRQSANADVLVWKHKAKKRGLIIGIGVALPAAYGGYRAYKALFTTSK